ncbi:MAG: ABC transporter ATP-binding protein [Geodermatophilaceae bacterium]
MTVTVSRRMEERVGPASSEPAVRIDSVIQVFEKGLPPVLDRVSLDMAPGEFVCLLGASGCGKSTLLNIVAGLTEPSGGSVQVHASHPALMFQEPALMPWLTATANVELALRARGIARTERREEAQRLLELVNLSGSGKKRVHELSEGMRQRVALARSLAQDSQLLLMDEPFATLDAITRDVLHNELIRVWSERSLSVIFVTHNVRKAVRLGQRVILMSSRPGRIVREWAIDLEHPRSLESPEVSHVGAEITRVLHKEIARHGR